MFVLEMANLWIRRRADAGSSQRCKETNGHPAKKMHQINTFKSESDSSSSGYEFFTVD